MTERTKNIFVTLLLLQRGRYSSYFTNVTFVFLFFILVISAPTIAENHPLRQSALNDQSSGTLVSDKLIALDEGNISVDTIKTEGKIRDKVIVYEVVTADTLKSIAEKFQVNEKSITWLNKLSSTTLKKGTKLKIPPVTGVVHTVEPGDNIYAVAKKYEVNPQVIANFPFNEYSDNSFTLIPGTELIIPDGVIAEPKSPGGYIGTYTNVAQVASGVKGSSSFSWPTNGLITQYPAPWHMAFDIANRSNPPVMAADSGTVVYSRCISTGYGCHVIINHNNGYLTLYGHLIQQGIEEGAVVAQGQQIGVMGSTGYSTGVHLHFEVRQGTSLSASILLNPQNFLK